MGAIMSALDGLDGESIQRVLDYVLGRLSLGRPAGGARLFAPSVQSSAPTPAGDGPKKVHSIRDLKEEKQPESANQMAALVAYYLSELAPEDSMKSEISSADIEKYFKQAAFKLPGAIHKTLPNATAAGYFDSLQGGRYRLNPVGYNLVVHALPRSGSTVTTRAKPKSKAKKKKAKS